MSLDQLEAYTNRKLTNNVPTGSPTSQPTLEPSFVSQINYASSIEVVTFIGSGIDSSVNGIGLAASFSQVIGIVFNSDETKLIVTEMNKPTFRIIDIATATVTTLAVVGNHDSCNCCCI